MSNLLSTAIGRATRRPAISPRQWRPQPAPKRSAATVGKHRLGRVELLQLPGKGPEDLILDSDGRIYTGLDDGRILRSNADDTWTTIASTGGRPLGLEWHVDGRLLACDPFRGLVAIDTATADTEVLVDTVDGATLRFCSNASVTRDGTIYFTDSSQRFGFDENMADVLEHSCTGRLIRLVPGSKPEVLLDGLAFANGLTLAPDESSVVLVETFEYRLTRYWLTGPRAGTSETLVDNLPGIPDNMSTGSDGLFWVALSTPRNESLDRLLSMPGIFRQLAYALPGRLQPQPAKTLWVMAFDSAGTVHHDLQDNSGAYSLVTGVQEQNGRVYLSSLDASAIAYFDLADVGTVGRHG